MSAPRGRARTRTTMGVAILLGCAWAVGKALGQHRRTRRQAHTQSSAYPYPIRPSRMEATA